MLAPLEGTSDEHKVGANIFRNAELVFELSSAMRFAVGTLIQILEAMRTAGGRQISHVQGQALVVTEGRAVQPEALMVETKKGKQKGLEVLEELRGGMTETLADLFADDAEPYPA